MGISATTFLISFLLQSNLNCKAEVRLSFSFWNHLNISPELSERCSIHQQWVCPFHWMSPTDSRSSLSSPSSLHQIFQRRTLKEELFPAEVGDNCESDLVNKLDQSRLTDQLGDIGVSHPVDLVTTVQWLGNEVQQAAASLTRLRPLVACRGCFSFHSHSYWFLI